MGQLNLIYPRHPRSYSAGPSQRLSQIGAGDLAVAQNLRQQAGADGFTAMNWRHGATSIVMAEEMMTAFDADNLKAHPPQRPEQLRTADRRKRAHAGTRTRCTPTNWLLVGSSTSRQSAIAWRMRFISVSRDLAWV